MSASSMTRTITFISGKGGSGKTVTSSAIGQILSGLGYRVLLVDTDASTNGLTLLFLSQVTAFKRSADSPAGVFDSQDEATPVPISENLSIVPATFTMVQTDGYDLSKFEKSLQRIIETAADYDFVLLDAQAGSDGYAEIACSFGDQVVIVSEFDPISAQGVDRLKILFSQVMQPENTWILYNKVLPEFSSAINQGLVITRVLPPITWSVDVIRSFAQRTLAIDMGNPNEYTINIAQVISYLGGLDVRESVNQWLSKVRDLRKAPLLNDLEQMEREISALTRSSIEARIKQKQWRQYQIISAFFALLFIVAANFGFGLFSIKIPDVLIFGIPVDVPALSSIVITVLVILFTLLRPLLSTDKEIEELEKQKVIERRLDDLLERRQRLQAASDSLDRARLATLQ